MYNLEGARVVRGYDWIWGEKDGGNGCVGTIIKFGYDIVEVCWDTGVQQICRIGLDNKYDLIILDLSQCGIIHNYVKCNACTKTPIFGIRYMCELCEKCDLCSNCYHSNRHDLSHPFKRIDYPLAKGISLSPREYETPKLVYGLYMGAVVILRKYDKKIIPHGRPTGVISYNLKYGQGEERNLIKVDWKSRLGKKFMYFTGILDLKCLTPALGGYYYIKHLPICGKYNNDNDSSSSGDFVFPTRSETQLVHSSEIKKINEMKSHKMARIYERQPKNNYKINFDDCSEAFINHRKCMWPIMWFKEGDIVRIKKHYIEENNSNKLDVKKILQIISDGKLRVHDLEDINKVSIIDSKTAELIYRETDIVQ